MVGARERVDSGGEGKKGMQGSVITLASAYQRQHAGK